MGRHTRTPDEMEKIVPPRNEQGMRLQVYQRFTEGVHYEPIDQDQMAALLDFCGKCISIHRGMKPQYKYLDEFLGMCDAYWELMKRYNDDGIKLIPDVESFCAFSGVDRDTLMSWGNGNSDKEEGFTVAVKTNWNMMAACKKQLAFNGKIPPLVFATDFNNNHGYTQKQETTITVRNPFASTTDAKELSEKYAATVPDDE